MPHCMYCYILLSVSKNNLASYAAPMLMREAKLMQDFLRLSTEFGGRSFGLLDVAGLTNYTVQDFPGWGQFADQRGDDRS